MQSTLSERLREATRSVHREVERAPLMRCLLQGRLDRRDYAALIANLLPIYFALERELARPAWRSLLAPLPLAAVARVPALAGDLQELRATDANPPPPVPAGTAHVDRIEALGAGEPARLVGHAYVRYLGDLAGGQVLSRVVRSRIGAPVAFYDFGPAPVAAALTDEFRSGLDRLALDATGVEAVVDEALWAFRQHGRLFEELAQAAPSCAPC